MKYILIYENIIIGLLIFLCLVNTLNKPDMLSQTFNTGSYAGLGGEHRDGEESVFLRELASMVPIVLGQTMP